MATLTLHLQLPDDLAAKLTAHAHARGMSVAALLTPEAERLAAEQARSL
jgi:ATP-dependent Clp protease adapter protein ClpS